MAIRSFKLDDPAVMVVAQHSSSPADGRAVTSRIRVRP